MKTFFLMILFLLSFKTVLAQNSREIESIKFVKSLVMKLQENTPFSYSDEEFYLGGFMGFTILSQLGYQDKAGRWLKSKPKYSYIGELLRQNRELILSKKARMKIYASGTSLQGEKIYDNKTFVYVTLEWASNSKEAFLCCTKNNYRIVTFTVFTPISGYKKSIYFENILVNGEPIAYLLGFRRKEILVEHPTRTQEVLVGYLPDKNLEALKLHVSKLK